MTAHLAAARRTLYAGAILLAAASGASAQVGAPATQMVDVEGRAMRVAVAGLQQRTLRAEYELVLSEMGNDFPEARSLRRPTGVPVVVVRASPPGRTLDVVEFDETELAGVALRSPKGLYLSAAHVSHHIHRDDPGLVVYLVQHVLKYAVISQRAP